MVGTANSTAKLTSPLRPILKPAFIFTRTAINKKLAAGLLQWTSARFQELVNSLKKLIWDVGHDRVAP